MGRVCKSCGEEKSSDCFTPFTGGKNGLYPHCKPCRIPKSKADYAKVRHTKRLWQRAKHRASLWNLPFNIDEEDVVIPDVCPVFKVPMRIGTKYAPSLDRINPRKGYVKGNVQVISTRANMLKNDATAEELRMIADFVEIGTLKDG
jgi:hypothetical protein